jgi:hypothetical protein
VGAVRVWLEILTAEAPAELGLADPPVAQDQRFDIGETLLTRLQVAKVCSETFQAARVGVGREDLRGDVSDSSSEEAERLKGIELG